MITPVHGFINRAHDLKSLFENTNKLSTFMNVLEKQSLLDPLRYDSNKYKGDSFELLVEILLKSHAYDNRLGISKYEPIQIDDNGVDGIGFNLTGDKCVVQVKYRSNNKSLLSSNKDHLANLISDGMIKHGVTVSESNLNCPRHYVITTASGLHHYTDSENFKGYVHCIGYNQLRSILDGNISFWNLCRDISNQVITNGK